MSGKQRTSVACLTERRRSKNSSSRRGRSEKRKSSKRISASCIQRVVSSFRAIQYVKSTINSCEFCFIRVVAVVLSEIRARKTRTGAGSSRIIGFFLTSGDRNRNTNIENNIRNQKIFQEAAIDLYLFTYSTFEKYNNITSRGHRKRVEPVMKRARGLDC